MEKISLIILNYNGRDNTLRCLISLKKLLLPNNIKFETIVVDNCSQDDSLKHVRNEFPDVLIIENKDNLGFSQGNNIGIQYALEHGADYIVILNSDTIVDKNFIKELLIEAKMSDKVGIVVPKIYFAQGFEFHKDRYKQEELGKVLWYAGGIMDWSNVIGFHRGVDEIDKGQYDESIETQFASGCCMFIKKEVLKDVGLLDKKYFLYYEDNDLSVRAKKAGYKIIYVPKAVIWHKNAGSAGGSGSKLQDYYITRNRLLFGMRYAPLRSKMAILREGLGILLKGRYWQRRGVLDFFLRKFGKGSFIYE